MVKLKQRMILDVSAEIADALDVTAAAGGMSRQDVVRHVLDAAYPHFGNLAAVFKAAKEQQAEAMHHVLLGMAAKASLGTGELLLEMSKANKKGKKGGGKST